MNIVLSRESQSPFKNYVLASSPTSNKTSESQQWYISLETWDLKTLETIQKASGSHFTCLMISAQFGALRRHLLETKRLEELPEFLWIGSSLAWPNHPKTFTNHWTMSFLKCPLKIADPLERLKWLEKFYADYDKHEYDVKGILVLQPLLRLLPTWTRRWILRYDFALRNIPLFFGYLTLSTEKHSLLGRAVKKLYLSQICADVIPVGKCNTWCNKRVSKMIIFCNTAFLHKF